MKFTVQYPIAHHGYDPALLDGGAVTSVSQTAETAGFAAIAFTDHPAPSKKWLDSGGHDSFDPLTALAFCAAATKLIRLQTYLLVLPYRNPLLAAKQIATVDVLSGGRLTLAVGTGYLRSEFAALGVHFEERNALFDEAIEVISAICSRDSLQYDGLHFKAPGQTLSPRPVQQPRPPIWIGGNSRKARQRAASYAEGWTPLLTDSTISQTIRTARISNAGDLRVAVDELRQFAAEAGRDPTSIDVQVEGQMSRLVSGSAAEIQDAVGALGDAGANWFVVDLPGTSVQQALEQLQWYGENVIRPMQGP